MKMRTLWFSALVGCVLAGPVSAQLGLPPECGTLKNAYGPYDYRTSLGTEQLHVVEAFHFDSNVENLRKGMSGTLGGDIGYTLRAFPNHHRALMSMLRLGYMLKAPKAPGAPFSVVCALMRAEAFQPEDVMVKVIYGHHLLKQGQRAAALDKLNAAHASNAKDANVAYNLGLAYFDAGDFGKSLENAHEAYRLGFPLPGLRDKLKRAGKWKDAPAAVEPVSQGAEAPLPAGEAAGSPAPEAAGKAN